MSTIKFIGTAFYNIMFYYLLWWGASSFVCGEVRALSIFEWTALERFGFILVCLAVVSLMWLGKKHRSNP